MPIRVTIVQRSPDLRVSFNTRETDVKVKVSVGLRGGGAVSFADLNGVIAAAQVPESVVTQHQAALALGWEQLVSGVPTTLAGYGITDAAPIAHITNYSNPHQVTKTQVGLSNVENTALSTWAGTANITTVGASAVTAHQAAIVIAASQVTSGTLAIARGGTNIGTYALGDTLYASAADTLLALAGNVTTTRKFLRQLGTGVVSAAPAWDTVTKADVGLTSVEDTALSTWAGTVNILTVGTIGTGTWNATAIGATKGGTAQTTWALGDTLHASATDTLAKLAGNITTTRKFLRQTGTGVVSAAPAWDTLAAADIAAGVFPVAATWSFAGSTILDLGTVTTVDINGGTVGGVTLDGTISGTPTWASTQAMSISGTAALASTVTVVDSTSATCSVALFDSDTGSLAAKTDAGLTYAATTGILTATGFSGPLNGTVGATTKAAGAFTTLSATGVITSFGNASAWGTAYFSAVEAAGGGQGAFFLQTNAPGGVGLVSNAFVDSSALWKAVAGVGVSRAYKIEANVSNDNFIVSRATGLTAGDTITWTNLLTVTSTGINSTVVGATTPAAGTFTTLAATGTATVTGAFGCNSKSAQTAYASGGLLAGVVAALVANGILSN